MFTLHHSDIVDKEVIILLVTNVHGMLLFCTGMKVYFFFFCYASIVCTPGAMFTL